MTILICSFLITSEAKHFFISLFPLRLFFFCTFPFHTSCFSSIGLLVLILLSLHLSVPCIQLFSSCLGSCFIFFTVSFIVRKILILIESTLSVIPLGFVLFVCYFKISYLTPGHIICLKNCTTLIFQIDFFYPSWIYFREYHLTCMNELLL